MLNKLELERKAYRKEIESLRDQLYNLLAILNRDGGHYREKHGTAKAIKNGIRLHYEYAQQADKYKYAYQLLLELLKEIEATGFLTPDTNSSVTHRDICKRYRRLLTDDPF